MTEVFVPAARQLPPQVAAADIVVAAPPELPQPTSPLLRLLPVGMSIATLGAMALALLSSPAGTRNPAWLALPMMMLVSVVLTSIAQRGRRHGGQIGADRADYLDYLTRLRRSVAETAAAQRASLTWHHPDPAVLWVWIGGPRMWERRSSDPDFCLVRVGIGTQPLSGRLIAPEIAAGQRSDPVTTAAARRFVRTHEALADVPVAVDLTATAALTVDGDPARVRALLRALICQLAVLHPPDPLLIAAVIDGPNRVHWDWLKWLRTINIRPPGIRWAPPAWCIKAWPRRAARWPIPGGGRTWW